MIFVLFTITFIGFIYGLCFIIGFCVKKVIKLSQQKNVLNEEENGIYLDQTPTMIFHVITPDNENGIEGSSENVSQTETFNSHELFAGRAQFAGHGFHK